MICNLKNVSHLVWSHRRTLHVQEFVALIREKGDLTTRGGVVKIYWVKTHKPDTMRKTGPCPKEKS
jgi:hypothetical protein